MKTYVAAILYRNGGDIYIYISFLLNVEIDCMADILATAACTMARQKQLNGSQWKERSTGRLYSKWRWIGKVEARGRWRLSVFKQGNVILAADVEMATIRQKKNRNWQRFKRQKWQWWSWQLEFGDNDGVGSSNLASGLEGERHNGYDARIKGHRFCYCGWCKLDDEEIARPE